MSTPFGITREVAVHAFGANCLQEKQSIVIVTRSVDAYEGVEIPLISKSLFNDRCDVKYMYAVTTLLSPTTAKVIDESDPYRSLLTEYLSFLVSLS
jgi:hypothetical protein